MPANQPTFRIRVEWVGVDIRFSAILRLVGVEANAVKVFKWVPHLIDSKIVSRGIPQRSTPDKGNVSRTRVVRPGIEIAVHGGHSSDADVLAHFRSHVVVSAHETAVPIQAKSRTELYGERGKILDVGLEICNGKHDALGNEFLGAYWDGKD
jgi:hypothetical protein